MPNVSPNGLAKENHRIILVEGRGAIIHKPTGVHDTFVAAARVYVIPMDVPRQYVQPKQFVGCHGAAA